MAIPYYFSEVTLTNAKLRDAAAAYARWALGTDEDLSRQRRLNVGVKIDWTEEDALRGEDLAGGDDCSIQTRSNTDLFLLRFRHREVDDPVRMWTTAVELKAGPDGLVVRHGAAVTGVTDHRLIPPPSTPRVVRDLLQAAGRQVLPRELFRPVTSFAVPDAAGLVEFILLDPARRLPVVVVTPTHDGALLVLADDLSARTVGMATLYRASDEHAARALTDELASRGFDRRFGVWGGAARLYAPHLRPGSDPFAHPLWTADRLSWMGGSQMGITVALSRQIARREVDRVTPPEHFQLIEAFDRQARQSALVERRDALQTTADARTLLDLAISENAKLTKTLERVQVEHRDKIADMELREEELEQQLSEARAKAVALEAGLNRRPVATTKSIDDDVVGALRSRLGGKFTVSDALIAIAAAYHDRIIILDSALSAAKRSHDFQWPDQAAGLLWTLAGPYFDALSAGKADSEAKALFGRDGYAATESEGLSQRGRLLRTFTYDGAQVEMLKHLKIGIGEGTATCLRIHFHWDSQRRRMVIGHCGRHLDFK